MPVQPINGQGFRDQGSFRKSWVKERIRLGAPPITVMPAAIPATERALSEEYPSGRRLGFWMRAVKQGAGEYGKVKHRTNVRIKDSGRACIIRYTRFRGESSARIYCGLDSICRTVKAGFSQGPSTIAGCVASQVLGGPWDIIVFSSAHRMFNGPQSHKCATMSPVGFSIMAHHTHAPVRGWVGNHLVVAKHSTQERVSLRRMLHGNGLG
jgi:hypothetical protein